VILNPTMSLVNSDDYHAYQYTSSGLKSLCRCRKKWIWGR